MDEENDYLTIDEAARSLGLTAGQMRRVLRRYGFGDLLRASMRKQITIRRTDLQKLRAAVRETPEGRGAA
jgi:hypothetical protein